MCEKQGKTGFVSAVLVAAGSSSRMGGIDKQFYPLNGIETILRTISAFQSCEKISEIVVVCRAEKTEELYRLVKEKKYDKVSRITAGGESRQQSVFRGIAACDSRAEYYAIHDGARPLVTDEIICDCLRGAEEYGAAAAAARCVDTLKRCDEQGFIDCTVDRENLYQVQTPQAFQAKLYRKAMQIAVEQEKDYTDDCQLMEAMGQRVFLTFGSRLNLKLTTPQDFILACAILKMREEM